MPLKRAPLALIVVFAALAAACASQPRMNDPQSSSTTVVAVPDRGSRGSGESDRRGSARADSQARRNNSDVLVELGQRYYSRGEYQVALEKLQSAIEIDATSASAHTVIAILYETIGDTAKAADHYRRSVQFGGRTGDILNNYGSWLCRQRRYAEADEHFRRAISDPFYKSPEAALANAGTCALAAGRYDSAENYLRQVLEARPDDDQALLGMAELSFFKEDYLRARAFLQRAESRAPLSRSALELAVKIEERLGDSGAAAAYRARLASSSGS
jgi:type IV pilus assembly protein PilF